MGTWMQPVGLAWAVVALVMAASGCAGRGPAARGILLKEARVGNRTHAYAVYVPREYDASKAWPCIVFLHGKGECGTDGLKQTAVGLGPAIAFDVERWPAIVIFPQKPDQASAWADHDALVMETLARTRATYHVDPARITLTGLSQGGAGTWAIGANHPEVWAALAPICGYGEPEDIAPRVTDLPTRAFHGDKDDVVPPAKTSAIVQAIVRERAKRHSASPPPQATFFTNANHNAWDPAYRDTDLAAWLIDQKRPAR